MPAASSGGMETDVFTLDVNEEPEFDRGLVEDELPDDLVWAGKLKELANMEAMEVGTVVPRPADKKVIRGGWVLKRKKRD